jgi:NAD(P)-dependent dehydrogenase (short-subunit alcohol dehydrogenase family)
VGRYDDRTVVITGGTSGIGLACAHRFVDDGARVLVTGRSGERLDGALVSLGPRAAGIRGDVGDRADVLALRDRVGRELGRADLVVLNAGVTAFAPVGDVTEEGYDELFAVNTRGPFFLLQHLLPLVPDGGSVVVTTSVANVRGLPGSSVYAATKAALRSMVRSFARELLPRGIRVNAVSPGAVDTGIVERVLPADEARRVLDGFEAANPMHRLGRAEEVAAAVAFLGFEATYTTGAELPVDGGATQL